MPSPTRVRLALGAIVLTYLGIGTLYAVHTPRWQVPDEPAHYNYIRQVVETRAFPVLEPGDYDQAYLSDLTSTRFPPDKPIGTLEYEDHQPPLYYLLAAPAFRASGGSLLALRLFSLALGAGVIVFTFFMVLEIFPTSPVLALTTAGFVAFVPQHMAMMAGVNNDALAELWIVVGLWLMVRGIGRTEGTGGTRAVREEFVLGLVIGLAFLTKSTAYLLAPVAGVALLLRWRSGGLRGRLLLRDLAIVFAPALLLGALWWGRNLAVYGWPDVMGLERHDLVVVGQPRTVEWIADLGWGEYLRRYFVTTFRSFWGQFGWMGVVMDWRVYLALLAYSLLLLLGCVGAVIRRRRGQSRLPQAQVNSLAGLATALLIAAALYLYYNLTFVQHQGRYLYPALSVVGLGAAIGIRQWTKWVITGARLEAQGLGLWLQFALPLIPISLMAALDVFALFRFIIPALQ